MLNTQRDGGLTSSRSNSRVAFSASQSVLAFILGSFALPVLTIITAYVSDMTESAVFYAALGIEAVLVAALAFFCPGSSI